MKHFPHTLPLLALPLLLAGCVSSTTVAGKPKPSAGGVNAFDAQVLHSLQGRDLTVFTSQFPQTDAPPKANVDARYDLVSASSQQGDDASYVVLLHRKTHQIWIQKTGPDGVQTFGPATVNSTAK